MALNAGFESLVEQAAIKWFKDLGYDYIHGSKISAEDRKDTTEVVLNKVLMDSLKKINPNVKGECIQEAYEALKTFNGKGGILTSSISGRWIALIILGSIPKIITP